MESTSHQLLLARRLLFVLLLGVFIGNATLVNYVDFWSSEVTELAEEQESEESEEIEKEMEKEEFFAHTKLLSMQDDLLLTLHVHLPSEIASLNFDLATPPPEQS